MPIANSFDLGKDNEKAYDDLIVAVEASDKILSLLLAVCDEPQLRDEIIQRYEAELRPRIRPYQVPLSRKEPSLREAIAEALSDDLYLHTGDRAVITITGADQLLSDKLGEERSEKEIFLGYLQWTREALREYPYPIILWLTNPLLTELSRKAPDFWSWRKDVFRFQSVLQQKFLDTPNNLPYSGTSLFIGREAELAELHEQLQRHDRLAISAITGMGGIGKTELALQYALKHLRDGTYPGGICWVSARQNIGTQILVFARVYLGLETPEDLELVSQVRWCWRYWRQGEVLVIYDDVSDYTDVKPFLPPPDPHFKVLLTTRLQLGESVNRLVLDGLPQDTALELLRSIVADDRIDQELDVAQELCAWLGYLPLALELAERYLARHPDLSLKRFLHRLRNQGLAARALTRLEAGMTASLNIQAAFELSWHELSESAQQLAGWLSLFAPAPIPWRLVEACVSELDSATLDALRDELIGLNLLRRTDEQSYQIHPLVRSFVADKLQQMTEEESMKQLFCREMVAEAAQIPAIPTRQLIEEITPAIPHIAEAATTLAPWLADDDLIVPYTGISRFYQGQAAYAQALLWLEQCLQVAETRLGSNNPDVATSLNNLAYLYQLQGRYIEAEPLYVRALQIREQQLGKDHPDTALSLSNLAELYRAMGRYTEAEPLVVRSLIIRKQQLGAEHPDVATSLNNLAELYRVQGRYAEAEPLIQRSLAIREQQLGTDHPDVATSLNNLANLYHSQGRYAESEPLLVRSLEILTAKLGVNHPNTQQVRENLATLYDKMAAQFKRLECYNNVVEYLEKAIALRQLSG
jgi:tetratricopeptide (TPR) repeat protein